MKPIWDRLNVEMLLTRMVAWLPNLFAAILILFGFWILFRVTRFGLERVLARAGFDRALAAMILNVYRFTILAFGVIMAVNQLGVNVGAALAGLGVVGLTIGFAAKDTLSNVMAGFLIFWDKPFHADDWVTIGESYGRVAEITMRTTRLLTSNNTMVVIPNETVISHVLVNHSAGSHSRVEVPITADAKLDLGLTRAAILEAIGSVEGVLSTPPPQVVLKSINTASMDLVIHAWIANAQLQRPVFFEILEASKPALDRLAEPSLAVGR
jgi:small conductance mechanosensitive channel